MTDPLQPRFSNMMHTFADEEKSFKKKHDKVKNELDKTKKTLIISGVIVCFVLMVVLIGYFSKSANAPAPQINQTTEINMLPAVQSMPAPVVIVNDTLPADHVVDVQVLTPVVEEQPGTLVLEPEKPAQVPKIPPVVRINIKPTPKAEKPSEPAQKEPEPVIETYSQISFGLRGCAHTRLQRKSTQ